MGKIIISKDLSDTGFTLRPAYRNGTPPGLLRTERAYDPGRDKKTHNPRSLGVLADRAGFSRPYGRPVSIDIQVKAAQSDVYYLPRELLQFKEALQCTINRAHNRSASAFTQGAFMQIRQSLISPATSWHYDIGNPSLTFLVADQHIAKYAAGFPLRLLPEMKRAFREASLSQMEGREMLFAATDFKTLRKFRKNAVPIIQMQPYELVEHDHLALHKGTLSKDRTLYTLGYIDSDQPDFYGFYGLDNKMKPDISKVRTAPREEAVERLVRYLKRYPAPVA